MKRVPTDVELQQAHDAFNADHERLRRELLAALPLKVAAADLAAERRRRSVWITALTSVCVTVVVLAWMVAGDFSHPPAFALDGVQDRMLQIRSLYVKGTRHETFDVGGKEVEQTYPLEWYAERSSRYFHTWSGTENNGAGIQVKTGFRGADGYLAFSVSDNDQVVTLTKSDAISTELSIESLLQHQWTNVIIRGATSNYRLVGNEEICGQMARKYEWVEDQDGTRSRNVIWLSEKSGLPVRSVVFEIDKSGRERISMNYETIEFDAPPPANRFPFVAPEGFRVVEAESTPSDFVIGSGSSGNVRSGMRYPFAIGDRAILVCWFCETRNGDPLAQEEAPVLPDARLRLNDGQKVTALNDRLCELIPLQTYADNEHLWRWTLAVPRDHRPIRPGEYLQLIFRGPEREMNVYAGSPLQLSEDRLMAMMARMKELGEPTDNSLPQVSLNRLRRLADRYVKGEPEQHGVNEEKK